MDKNGQNGRYGHYRQNKLCKISISSILSILLQNAYFIAEETPKLSLIILWPQKM